ncbi:MAG: hypothetical protein QOE64_1641 [Frankiales bacterium]|nr:hypothetical protein [Frankiales bacterium]
MTGSAVLDTVLGLVFTFYGLALVCSGLVEMIANWVKKRAKYLLRGLRDLLEGVTAVDETAVKRAMEVRPWGNMTMELAQYRTALGADASHGTRQLDATAVMGHALVQPFKHTTPLGKAVRNPAYLPASVFAQVVADLLTTGKTEPSMADLRASVAALPQVQLRQALTSLLKAAGEDVDKFLAATETWFNNQMERVSGSYKRWAKRWVIVIATVVVAAGGVDSIAIARTLYANDEIRASLVQAATNEQLCQPTDQPSACAKKSRDFFTGSGLPFGWSRPNPGDGGWGWPLKILGLLISIGAASLGAPFWYKTLDRVGTLRSSEPNPGQQRT